MYPQLRCHTTCFTAPQLTSATPVHPSFPPSKSLEATYLFTVSVIFAFSRCQLLCLCSTSFCWVSWWQMVSPGSTRGRKGIETEKFIARRSWRKCTAYAGGAHVEVKAGCRQRGAGCGAWAFFKVHGWSASGFPAKPDWSVQTKRNGALISS